MARAPRNTDNPAPSEWDEPADEGITRAQDPDQVGADEQEADEAERRAELPNMQTTREREEGRDAVSGTKNPGVVAGQTGHSAQGVAGDNDMSGKKALPDPLLALDKARVDEIHKALQDADKQDVNAYRRPKHYDEGTDQAEVHKKASLRSTGWRSLADLGVHRDTLEALVKADKVEKGHAPGMQHHGDTGQLYRIKKDRG